MPLTSKGFERLTYDDIVNKKIQKAKEYKHMMFTEAAEIAKKS